jgi:hypothetical protein
MKLKDLHQINDPAPGMPYLIVDKRTGILYKSTVPIDKFVRYELTSSKNLGAVPLLIPILTAVGTVGGGVFNFLGQMEEAKAAEANAAAQAQILAAQQAGRANQQQQQMMLFGGLGLGAIMLIVMLKN